MRFFHRTSVAEVILREGFRDGSGSYGLASTVLQGVFVSEEPLDDSEGATGDTVLEVFMPGDADAFQRWELIEDLKPYREWCIPAKRLNALGKVRALAESEVEDILDDLFEERHPGWVPRDLPPGRKGPE